jgi:hypothetical protein
MPFHSYNHGLVTSTKGLAIEAAKITTLDVAAGSGSTHYCTIAEQGNSNLIASVEHTSTGVYTVTLNKPYPPALVLCIPAISSTSATTDLIHARYTDASYNSTTGTFTIQLINDDDSGAGVEVAGGSANELHLLMMFRRYTSVHGTNG